LTAKRRDKGMTTESNQDKKKQNVSGQIAAKGYAKEYFAVGAIKTNTKISGTGLYEFEKDLDLKWADGMVGVIPVFETIEEAEAYSEDGASIIKLETGA
jgi:hypothetical protein